MTEQNLWTPEEAIEALQTAIAIAAAAHQDDPVAVATLWNEAPNKPALIHQMGRLPSAMIRAVSARQELSLDPAEIFEHLLLALHPDHPNDNPEEGNA